MLRKRILKFWLMLNVLSRNRVTSAERKKLGKFIILFEKNDFFCPPVYASLLAAGLVSVSFLFLYNVYLIIWVGCLYGDCNAWGNFFGGVRYSQNFPADIFLNDENDCFLSAIRRI